MTAADIPTGQDGPDLAVAQGLVSEGLVREGLSRGGFLRLTGSAALGVIGGPALLGGAAQARSWSG